MDSVTVGILPPVISTNGRNLTTQKWHTTMNRQSSKSKVQGSKLKAQREVDHRMDPDWGGYGAPPYENKMCLQTKEAGSIVVSTAIGAVAS